ncbi:hypothetical protein CRM22_001764 [Opisthorchis felineus]|uniref:glucose-6-phosphatase n=1 Tax=Opisthorchis felineus TaxID=147828 RepID=A0A4S2M929_OPIFE|nr:hypothetical protein CRM22_001764 [Opisthorchis felineus]
MESLHVRGVGFIQWIQQFQYLDSLMINTSHLGSPLIAYALVFPLAYYLNPTLGLLTMLCASFTEWFSGLLKWILHGHRPYWWVGLYARKTNTAVMHLEQFPVTCETGPGSPSGHCMITLASLVPLVLYLHQCLLSPYGELVLLIFGLFTLVLGLSRCYLAAHFPHQVLAGVVSGLCFGYFFTHLFQVAQLASKPSKSTLNHGMVNYLVYLIRTPGLLIGFGFGSLLLAWMFGWFLQTILGVDINWSVKLAQRACRRPEWVHLSSSLMVGFARIAGYLSGLAIAICLCPPPDRSLWTPNTNLSVVPLAVISVIVTKLIEALCRRAVSALLMPILPPSNSTGPGVALLASSVVEGSVGPLIAVWVLPSMLGKLGRLHE